MDRQLREGSEMSNVTLTLYRSEIEEKHHFPLIEEAARYALKRLNEKTVFMPRSITDAEGEIWAPSVRFPLQEQLEALAGQFGPGWIQIDRGLVHALLEAKLSLETVAQPETVDASPLHDIRIGMGPQAWQLDCTMTQPPPEYIYSNDEHEFIMEAPGIEGVVSSSGWFAPNGMRTRLIYDPVIKDFREDYAWDVLVMGTAMITFTRDMPQKRIAV